MAAPRMKCKIVYLFLIYQIITLDAKLSDLRLCADPKCEEPISHGKTAMKYRSGDKDVMSFPANVDVIIYSKSAGSVENLWGGVINKQRGYFPKQFIVESRVLRPTRFVVSTHDSKVTDDAPPVHPPISSSTGDDQPMDNQIPSTPQVSVATNQSDNNRDVKDSPDQPDKPNKSIPYPSFQDDSEQSDSGTNSMVQVQTTTLQGEETPNAESSSSVLSQAIDIMTSVMSVASATLTGKVVAHTEEVASGSAPDSTHSAVWFPDAAVSQSTLLATGSRSFGLPGAYSAAAEADLSSSPLPPTPQEYFQSGPYEHPATSKLPDGVHLVDGTTYQVIDGTTIPTDDDMNLPPATQYSASSGPAATESVVTELVSSVSILPTPVSTDMVHTTAPASEVSFASVVESSEHVKQLVDTAAPVGSSSFDPSVVTTVRDAEATSVSATKVDQPSTEVHQPSTDKSDPSEDISPRAWLEEDSPAGFLNKINNFLFPDDDEFGSNRMVDSESVTRNDGQSVEGSRVVREVNTASDDVKKPSPPTSVEQHSPEVATDIPYTKEDDEDGDDSPDDVDDDGQDDSPDDDRVDGPDDGPDDESDDEEDEEMNQAQRDHEIGYHGNDDVSASGHDSVTVTGESSMGEENDQSTKNEDASQSASIGSDELIARARPTISPTGGWHFRAPGVINQETSETRQGLNEDVSDGQAAQDEKADTTGSGRRLLTVDEGVASRPTEPPKVDILADVSETKPKPKDEPDPVINKVPHNTVEVATNDDVSNNLKVGGSGNDDQPIKPPDDVTSSSDGSTNIGAAGSINTKTDEPGSDNTKVDQLNSSDAEENLFSNNDDLKDGSASSSEANVVPQSDVVSKVDPKSSIDAVVDPQVSANSEPQTSANAKENSLVSDSTEDKGFDPYAIPSTDSNDPYSSYNTKDDHLDKASLQYDNSSTTDDLYNNASSTDNMDDHNLSEGDAYGAGDLKDDPHTRTDKVDLLNKAETKLGESSVRVVGHNDESKEKSVAVDDSPKDADTLGTSEVGKVAEPPSIAEENLTDPPGGGGWFFSRSQSESAVPDEVLETESCSAPGHDGGSCADVVVQAGGREESPEEDKDPMTEKEPLVEGPTRSFGESLDDYFKWLKGGMQAVVDLFPDPTRLFLYRLEDSAISPRVVVFTVIIGFFVFLLQVVYMLFKVRSKESALVAKICSMDSRMFAAVTERDELKRELVSVGDSTHDWEMECAEARKCVKKLQNELKATQSDGGKLHSAVEELHRQLEGQQHQVAELQLVSETAHSEKMQLKAELDDIQEEYDQLKESYSKLEDTRDELERTRNDLMGDTAAQQDQLLQLSQSNQVLLKEAEVWNESVKQLESQLLEDQSTIHELTERATFKDKELEALKECVAKLSIRTSAGDTVDGSPTSDEEGPSEDAVEEVLKKLMDVSTTKAELRAAMEERSSLLTALEAEKVARAAAESFVENAAQESAKFKEEYEVAHREREEAQTRLGVLSNYFKEKELQLQKELGVQEAMRQQTQDSVTSVTHRIAVYEQEIDLLKSQVTSLKLEIDSQERSYKNQITNHEKKAHENWLAARSAERKLEETKQEATNLRNKLTLVEQEKSSMALSQAETTKGHNAYPGSNGEVPTSPRLGANDRSDSMDLPTSGRSSLFREPLDPLQHHLHLHHMPPFLPPDRPMPPPFLHGGRPPMLPPPPPLHPFDPRRGHFLPPPPLPPPGMISPDHWGMPPGGARRSPPYEHPSGRQSDHQRSHSPPRRLPPPSFHDRRPSISDDYPEPPAYSRDFRGNTPPSRFYDRPHGGGGGGPPPPLSPPPIYGSAGVRPPLQQQQPQRRDIYPPGRADLGINPRTSSPMTSHQQNDSNRT